MFDLQNLTPQYNIPIGLTIDEFINCLIVGEEFLELPTDLVCTVYSGLNRATNQVFMAFDEQPGLPLPSCDFYFEFHMDGYIVAARVAEEEMLQHKREWVRYLMDNKVVITGLKPIGGSAMIQLVGKRNDLVN